MWWFFPFSNRRDRNTFLQGSISPHFVIFSLSLFFFWHPYFQPHICQLCAEELNVEHLSLGLIILLSKGFLHPEIFEIKALKNKAVAL